MIRKLIVILGHIGLAVAIFIGLGVMSSMQPEQERQEVEPRLPAAFVEEVRFSPMALTVYAQGEVEPLREISLTPQVSGRITGVSEKFVDGGIIQEGDLLVQLEDEDYRSSVARAQARVASARQTLEVERAEADLARRDFEELGGLSGGEAPSALTLRQPQLARAEAELDAAIADLTDAELNLRRTQIRAPFDGRVRSISVNLGQFVSPGQAIGELFSTDIAEVRLPLTDADLAKLQLPLAFSAENGVDAPEVRFSAEAANQQRNWTGKLVRIAAAIDPTTRQISAIAQVEDPYGEGSDNGFPMAIGLFVRAEINGPTLDRAVLLPRIAVSENDEVFTLDENDIVRRNPVTVAARTAEGVVITSGLDEGARVIVSRVPTSVGRPVRPLDPSSFEEAAAAPATASGPTAGSLEDRGVE